MIAKERLRLWRTSIFAESDLAGLHLLIVQLVSTKVVGGDRELFIKSLRLRLLHQRLVRKNRPWVGAPNTQFSFSFGVVSTGTLLKDTKLSFSAAVFKTDTLLYCTCLKCRQRRIPDAMQCLTLQNQSFTLRTHARLQRA